MVSLISLIAESWKYGEYIIIFFFPFQLDHMEILGVWEQAKLQAIAKAPPSFFQLPG